MIIAANKYGSVRSQAGSKASPASKRRTPAASPQILIPSPAARRILLRDWWHRECKEGGFLQKYVRREKGQMPLMLRRVARLMAGFQQNNKSDFRLVASVPARLYQRLKAEDPDFFSDNQNLKNLKRDNPDAFVKI